jgi:hypothetical protein
MFIVRGVKEYEDLLVHHQPIQSLQRHFLRWDHFDEIAGAVRWVLLSLCQFLLPLIDSDVGWSFTLWFTFLFSSILVDCCLLPLASQK